MQSFKNRFVALQWPQVLSEYILIGVAIFLSLHFFFRMLFMLFQTS